MSIALIGTAAASLAALLAPVGWPFELFAHFRWQVGVAALALLLASLVLRRPWMMVVACVTVVMQWLPGILVSGRAVAHEPAARTCSDDPLRVVTANAWLANIDHAALVAWLRDSDADIIALQEITPRWASALEPLARTYPYRKVIPREDPYGIALLSRWPIDDVQTMDFSGDGMPSLVADVDVHGRKLRVIALHTLAGDAGTAGRARPDAGAGGCTRAHSARRDDPAGRPQPDAVRTGVRTARVRVRIAGRPGRRGLAADVAGGILAARAANRSRAGAAAQLRHRA
ncbi:MAG: endonuclease/exonuclease/phosphatase family protein [Proteobacteria bacterium]|nr:endonuclease/exonuclease/phosphatase family protein [Pseudomonadota bacterium]